MAAVEYEGARVELAPGETVLDGLLRAGHDAPHSCRAGHCLVCVARAVDGDAPPASQSTLKDAWRAQGLFLPCRAVPDRDLRVARADSATLEIGATVVDVARISHDVVRVRLEPDAPLGHRGGQFVTLVRADGLARSYSTADVPALDPWIELHVREIQGGAMSGWIATTLARGDRVALRGPFGDCFYVEGRPEQPLLLAGTGTGLAPLVAIARDALSRGHKGRIALVHGAVVERGLYLGDELDALARAHASFELTRCVLHGEPRAGLDVGALDALVRSRFTKLAGWRVFLCGDPVLVQTMKRNAFLAGARLQDLHADAFHSRPAPSSSAR